MSPETPIPETAAEPGSSRAATHAVVVALVAITAFGVLAIASQLGWLPRMGGKAAGFDPDKAGAITRPEPGPARSAVPLASALLPGETVVAPPEPPAAARPGEPLMPHYSDPVAPRPAPPRPAEEAPAPPPASASAQPATQPAATPRPAPATPRWVRPAPSADPGIPIRPVPRYAESRRDEPRPGRAACPHCGVVTEISPSIDQWDVHVRFEDGTRRVLRYPTPPNVGRGDRVVFEHGRLDLR